MREWLVTNGLGGYASLTYQNTNTRKFHGLLIASLNPPIKRWVFVSNVFDQISSNGIEYNLKNHRNKYSFDVYPSFTYEFKDLAIKKTIFMEYEKNTTIIRYKIDTNKPFTIYHDPIVNSRHFYDVNRQRCLSFNSEIIKNGIIIKPGNVEKTLKIFLKDAEFQPLNYWKELFYSADRVRNESWVDNNLHVGRFQKNIKNSCDYYLVLTLEDDLHINPAEIYTKEIKRKRDFLLNSELPVKCNNLVLSADNFLVKKGNSKSVIAGYHWFGDWGRDTLIALPGLTLVTKRFDDAKQILKTLSEYCRNGLIPNAFMDRDSDVVYNTVDASLWFIDRVYQYLKYTNDQDFINEIWETLCSIIESYKNGTDYGIHMDDDFLISHDSGLTWMDVKLNDYYPTPRTRKAVEIQALWYNALMIMSKFANLLEKEDWYSDLANSVKKSFNSQYNKQYDVIDTKDLLSRPNKLFLASLDFDMIDKKMQKKIVDEVQKELVTIFGLRTLSPRDSNYKGSYIGDYNKDIAYHNGTVWPWLMGSFIKAHVKVKNQRELAFENFLKPMLEVYGDQWDGSIHEIFDGDPIYTPRGCISQAWSVAEILRTWVEDIENIKPEYEKILISPKIRV